MGGLFSLWRMSQSENVGGGGLNAAAVTDSVSPFAFCEFANRVILVYRNSSIIAEQA